MSETVKLGNMCDYINGGAWSDKEYVGIGIPVLKVSNFKPSGFSLEDVSRLPASSLEKYKRNLLSKGDMVIATVGSHPNLVNSAAGRSCGITDEVAGYLLNQNAVCVRTLNPEVLDQRYLTYLGKSYYFQHYIQSRGRGAANQMRIAISAIKEYVFDLPNIEIQRWIADILSNYDDLIENNQKQIKLLEEATQRMYKEWFVDLHFPGYEKTTIVDGIPSGWKVKSILDNEVFIFSKSRIKSFDGEKQYYATADVTGTYATTEGERINFTKRPSRAQYEPALFSVWFARMSNSYKIWGFAHANEKRVTNTILSSGFVGFEAKPKSWPFVYCTITSKSFDSEKDRFATGSTQVSLTNEGLKKIKVLIPTEAIIAEFGYHVNPMIEKVITLYECCYLLRQARDRLLPKLMSGEIEV